MLKFCYVTDKNFEDIFEVSAKYEQWEYVKHHIFDMVNNYVAVVNEAYLPIPFLVYEDSKVTGYVQVNCNGESYEICKLIVHESEQNKGYGTRILSEMMKWISVRFGRGTVTGTYKASNLAADKLFLNAGFDREVTDGEVTASRKLHCCETALSDSEFEKIPYAAVGEFTAKIREAKKYPESIIGDEKGIHFEKIHGEHARKIIAMELLKTQEGYVMPFVDSLAQSYSDLFEEEITVPYALCHGPNPVGLVEIRYVKGEGFPVFQEKMVYELFRILVDKEYQKKGYGTGAIQLFLDYVKRKPLGDADAVVVSVVEGNEVALKLYERFGFQIIGRDKYEHIALGQDLRIH